MARLNIEDSLFSDERFIKLRQILGCRDKAMGLVVFAWRFAQRHVSIENPKGLMSLEDFLNDSPNNGLLVDCGLIQICDQNPLLCYAKGAKSQFSWLVSRMRNSRIAVACRREINNLQRPYGNRNEPYGDPLTLTLTQNKENIKRKQNAKHTNMQTSCHPQASDALTLISLWNNNCRTLPKVLTSRTPARRLKKINTLWPKFSEAEWLNIINKITASDFCLGMGPTKWKATFDWMLNEINIAKVLEGNYQNEISIRANAEITDTFSKSILSKLENGDSL